eukprot:scaffold30643_cov35-Tisochrysis_lutea.AAC.2
MPVQRDARLVNAEGRGKGCHQLARGHKEERRDTWVTLADTLKLRRRDKAMLNAIQRVTSFKNASSSTHAEQKHGVECGPSVPLYWHEAKETYAGSSTEPNRPVGGGQRGRRLKTIATSPLPKPLVEWARQRSNLHAMRASTAEGKGTSSGPDNHTCSPSLAPDAMAPSLTR